MNITQFHKQYGKFARNNKNNEIYKINKIHINKTLADDSYMIEYSNIYSPELTYVRELNNFLEKFGFLNEEPPLDLVEGTSDNKKMGDIWKNVANRLDIKQKERVYPSEEQKTLIDEMLDLIAQSKELENKMNIKRAELEI